MEGYDGGQGQSAAAGGGITNINISAGATSNNLSAFTFSNSNGVSFGLTGSVITGTVATNYQSPGAYLTTADLSQNSSLYQSTGAYLTTAALSQNTSNYAGINSAITGGSLTVNTSGVSINLPAYLTTAMASNRATDFVAATAAFAGTNASGTINSTGISVSVAAPGGGGGPTIQGSGTYTQNTGTIQFSNSNGVTFGLSNNGVMTATVVTSYQAAGNYLTTADLSANSSNYIAAWKLTGNQAGTTSSAQGTVLWLAGGNGVTVSGSSNTLSFSVATNYQSQAAYLTTAALSQNSSLYAGVNGAITGGSITVNTSGVSVNLPAYLTTADLSANSSKYVQNWKLTGNVAGTTSSANGTDLWFGGGNGVTISGSSGSISFSVATNYQAPGAYLTTAALSANTSNYAGINGAITGGSITVNTSGVSVNLPAYLTTAALSANTSNYAGINSAITGGLMTVNTSGISVNVTTKNISWFENHPGGPVASFAMATNSAALNLSIQRIQIAAPFTVTRLDFLANLTIVASTAGSTTMNLCCYTRNASSLSSASSTANTVSLNSGTGSLSTASYGAHSGTRWRSCAINSWAMTPGEYYIGFINSVQGPAGTTGSMTGYGLTSISVLQGVAQASQMSDYFANGIYSAATGAFPTSIGLSGVQQSGTAPLQQLYFRLIGSYS